jgi:hypothetical protein
MHITACGNTEVPAYLALQQAGFDVSRRICEDGLEMWIAKRDPVMFSGPSALEVLGLYAMWQIRGDDWKTTDDELDTYLAKYYPESLL